MNITFREYKPGEEAHISQLLWKLNKEDTEELPQSEKKIQTLFEYIKTHDSVKIFVVNDGGVVVGYGVLVLGFSIEWSGIYSEIDELYVLREYRNKGIGTRFIHWIEKQAKLLGSNAMFLVATNGNQKAQKLYERVGYTGLLRKSFVKHL